MENSDTNLKAKVQSFRDVSQALHSAVQLLEQGCNGLPTDHDFHFYTNFQAFKVPVKSIQKRTIGLLSEVSATKAFRASPVVDWPADNEEGYHALVELQDDFLERLDASLEKPDAERHGKNVASSDVSSSNSGERGELLGTPEVKIASIVPSFLPRKTPYASSRHMPKPQDKFDEAVDNFTPFKHPRRNPWVKEADKDEVDVSAAAPENGAMEAELDDSAGDVHPLENELNEMAYVEPLSEPLEATKPGSLEDTPFTFVDTQASLKTMAKKLRNAGEIAVDLENHHYRSYLGFVCLMQVSTRQEDFVVDTIALRSHIGPCLGDIFSDSRIRKVMHGADHDIVWLQRDFGIYVCNMFDTGQAARVLKLPSAGLGFLLESYCGVIADKRLQLADWRVRPLPGDMMKYAREDTHYLLYIHDMMKNQLLVIRDGPNPCEDPLTEVWKRSRDICLQLFSNEPLSETSYLNLHGLYEKNFRPDQVAAVAKLHAWRDNMARKEDESIGYVIPTHMLFDLASEMPETVAKLKYVASKKGSRRMPGIMNFYSGVLVDLIRQAKENPIFTPVQPRVRPTFIGSDSGQGVSTSKVAGELGGVKEGLSPSMKQQTLEPEAVSMLDTALLSKPLAEPTFEEPDDWHHLESDLTTGVHLGTSASVSREPTPEARNAGTVEEKIVSQPNFGLLSAEQPVDSQLPCPVVPSLLSNNIDSITLHGGVTRQENSTYSTGAVEDAHFPHSDTQIPTKNVAEVKLRSKTKGFGASLFGRSRQQKGEYQTAAQTGQVEARLKAQAVESTIVLPFKSVTTSTVEPVLNAAGEDFKDEEAVDMSVFKTDSPEHAGTVQRQEGEEEAVSLEAAFIPALGKDDGEVKYMDSAAGEGRHRTWWPHAGEPAGEESMGGGASERSVDLVSMASKDVPSHTKADQLDSSFPPSLSESHRSSKRKKRNRGGGTALPVPGGGLNTGASISGEQTDKRKKAKVDRPLSKGGVDLDTCAVNGSFDYAEARRRLGVENLYVEKVDEKDSKGKGKFNKKPNSSKKNLSSGFDALRRVRQDPKPEGIPKAPRRQVYSMTGNRSATFRK
ncbi:exosome complex exonuclease RRP6 [Marchantia polymorpha subsp. ruderalis]|uniref:HRDC domain-containing protein n=2 Tax=Marchantia polymorpha TaxID=3197 RepID=A0AAF6BYY7_MARPO|nr:hypothetical protein MARPO_0003s0296 [Marchantia polymorpha]BBN17221.1 hypothetical protein Mp_7g12880 [Marchantia polymorpha subsp. ruderalis]|eukprot:PTQ49456.1 hypothetical protein MARPO_0003s0296 [Marchantia polymorpha]